MKTRGPVERIKQKYFEKVSIPKRYKRFFWDHPEGKVYLEKFILRVLIYGDFEDIKMLYKKYPCQTLDIAFRYPEIKRGVKFWLRWWHER